MKIALVSDTFPPDINGVAMTLHRLETGLLGRGHSVHLCRPKSDLVKEMRDGQGASFQRDRAASWERDI
jgi:hypothetical protein